GVDRRHRLLQEPVDLGQQLDAARLLDGRGPKKVTRRIEVVYGSGPTRSCPDWRDWRDCRGCRGEKDEALHGTSLACAEAAAIEPAFDFRMTLERSPSAGEPGPPRSCLTRSPGQRNPQPHATLARAGIESRIRPLEARPLRRFAAAGRQPIVPDRRIGLRQPGDVPVVGKNGVARRTYGEAHESLLDVCEA